MAKDHRYPRLITSAALAASVALAAGLLTDRPSRHSATDLLASYVFGVGGSNDKNGANIPAKLNGEMIGERTYQPIVYSAGVPVDPSVAEAIPLLLDVVDDMEDDDDAVVIGYSEGAVVVEHVRRTLEHDPGAPPAQDLRFIQVAGPSVPNGGIYARFTVGLVPGFTTTGPTQPTKYDTTYVTVEYDTVADFPAYFNLLAIANAVIAFLPVHPDPSYNAADIDPLPANSKVVDDNGAGGTDTYVFIRVDELPLLWPVRVTSELIGTTEFTEPLLDLVEPTLRVLIDMGYTDRENLNPEQHVPFSLFTPPEKVEEAVAALPSAFEEGRADFEEGVQAWFPDSDDGAADVVAADEPAADELGAASDDDVADSDDPRPGIRLLRLLRGDRGAAATTEQTSEDHASGDQAHEATPPAAADGETEAEDPQDANEPAADPS